MPIAMLALLLSCGVCHAATERWSNFAEDTDLKYYIDLRSIITLPDNVHIFWVKSIAKDKDYFKKEYNMNNVSYMFTSYELDCAVSSYRMRGSMMFDKNRKEISKSIPEGEPAFEPVPPESMLELAQEEVCVKAETTSNASEGEEHATAAPAAPAAPTAPEAPEAPVAPAAPAAAEEPPALQ
jgi:hypothetical protein